LPLLEVLTLDLSTTTATVNYPFN